MNITKTKWLLAIAVLAALISFGACNSNNSVMNIPPETTNPTINQPISQRDELIAVLTEVETQVRQIRKLTAPTTEVAYQLLSRSELADFLATYFAKEAINNADQVLNEEIAYKLLGVLQPNDSLADVRVELYSTGGAGFYDDNLVKVLYDDTEPIKQHTITTYVHEYVHYLQDQNYGIGHNTMQTPISGYDANLAFTALFEGDARYFETFYQQNFFKTVSKFDKNISLADLVAQAAQLRQHAMYPFLTSQVFFPYVIGHDFITTVLRANQNDVSIITQIFADPPKSTEQILMPLDKYIAQDGSILDVSMRDNPIEIDDTLFPQSANWRLTSFDDTFGVFSLESWLDVISGTVPSLLELPQIGNLSRASDGWGGDRVRVLERDDGTNGLQWILVWDEPTRDAEEFRALLNDAVSSNPSFVSNASCSLSGYAIDSLAYGDNVLVHTILDHSIYGQTNSIAVSSSCETALELISLNE